MLLHIWMKNVHLFFYNAYFLPFLGFPFTWVLTNLSMHSFCLIGCVPMVLSLSAYGIICDSIKRWFWKCYYDLYMMVVGIISLYIPCIMICFYSVFTKARAFVMFTKTYFPNSYTCNCYNFFFSIFWIQLIDVIIHCWVNHKCYWWYYLVTQRRVSNCYLMLSSVISKI